MKANIKRLTVSGMKTVGKVEDVGGKAVVVKDTAGLAANVLAQNPGATVQDLINKYGNGTYLRVEEAN